MSVLTWRDVAAPALSGGAQGYQTAGGLLDNATKDMSSGLAAFGQAQQQQAGTAAMANAMQYTDPAAYAEAQRTGALFNGVDMTQVTPDVVNNMNNRAASLISNASNTEKLNQERYADTRLQQQNANVDAAQPVIDKILAANQTGDQGTVDQLKTDNSTLLNNLPPEVMANLMSKSQALNQGSANLAGTLLTNKTSQFNYDVGTKQYADNQAGLAAGQQILLSSQSRDDAIQHLTNDDAYKNLNPQAREAALNHISTVYGNILTPGGVPGAPVTAGAPGAPIATGGAGGTGTPAAANIAVGGTPATGAGAITPITGPNGSSVFIPDFSGASAGVGGSTVTDKYNTVYGNVKTDTPLTAMTLGDITKKDGLQDSLIANPKAGNSPVGAYQINKKTLMDYAPKVLGANWQNMIMTPEVQDQIGEAIYNDRKKGDLSQTWTSLQKVPGANAVGAFANIPWSQAKNFIPVQEGADKGSTSNTTTLRNEVNTLNTQANTGTGLIAQRVATNNTGPQAALAAGISGTDTADSAADKLIANNPSLKGADKPWLVDKLNDIATRGGVTPDQAAGLLLQNTQSATTWLGTTKRGLQRVADLDISGVKHSPNLPSGMRVNDDAIEQAINQKGGLATAATVQGQQTQALHQKAIDVQAAQNQMNTAAVNLANLKYKAAYNPNLTPLVARADAQYIAAKQQLMMLTASLPNDAKMNFPIGYGGQ